MSNTKRCSGYKGHWECNEEYPDHQVPIEQFGPGGDGLQVRCRKCAKYYSVIRNPIANPTRPRHPDTNQLKVHWQTARAKEYYGGMPKDPRNDKRWKECRAMATKDSEAIDWVRPDDSQPSNVIPFKAKPKPAVTLKSTVRNDGLPKGIVTPSEKKVRREAKRIQYTPEGWIYALKDHMKEPGFLKLGKTNDLKRRLADFNTAGDFEMMHWVKVVDAKAAEDMLHAHFIDSHHLREWFKVDLKDAVEAMDSIADTVNDPDWEGIVDLGEADES